MLVASNIMHMDISDQEERNNMKAQAKRRYLQEEEIQLTSSPFRGRPTKPNSIKKAVYDANQAREDYIQSHMRYIPNF